MDGEVDMKRIYRLAYIQTALCGIQAPIGLQHTPATVYSPFGLCNKAVYGDKNQQ